MFYLNGKEVDFSNENKDYAYASIVADYHAYIAELKKRFGSNVIYLTKKQPARDKKTNNLRPVPLKSWPKMQTGVYMQVKENDKLVKKGPYSMVWNNGQVEIKNKMPQMEEKNFLVREGSKTVNLDTEPDFAYFLQFHNVVRSGEFYIFDPAKTAREKAVLYKEEQKVRDLIFSEFSPLQSNFNQLKVVARRWGVSGVDTRSPEEVSVDLFETVMAQESAKKRNPHIRGIKEFLADTQLGASVKAGALISLAEEKQILKYNPNQGEYQILFAGRTAAVPYLTIPQEQIHRKGDFLIDALVMDDSLMLKLESAVGVEKKERSVEVDISRIGEYKYQELQTIAATMGIKAIGVKQADLIELIKEKAQAGVE